MKIRELIPNWYSDPIKPMTVEYSPAAAERNAMSDKELLYRYSQILAPDYANDDYVSSVKSNWYVGQDSVGVTTQAATPGYSGSFGGYIVARKDRVMPNIEKIIFNPPATVVIWDDGTKTVVKAKESGRKKSDKDSFSEEYGLAMAIAKRYFGSRSAFLKAVENAKRPGAE